MNNIGNYSYADEQKLNRYLNTRQEEEALSSYIKLSKKCFSDCCEDFTTKTLTSKEEKCLDRCVKKFLFVTERLTCRFGENSLVQDLVQPTDPQ